MSLKSEMTCNICTLFLQDPISLPCHCVICHAHLSDGSVNKDGTIRCAKCNRHFDVPSEGFAANKMVQSILEKELHLSDEEKAIRNSIHELLSQLEALQKEIKSKHITDVEVSGYDHFSELRLKIDIHREELKSKIDEIALKMIDQTKEKEKVYKLKISEMFKEMTGADIKTENETLLNEFRRPNLIIADIVRQFNEQRLKIGEFKAKLVDFDRINSEIKEIEFQANQVLSRETFGMLKLSKPLKKLISCSVDKTIKVWDLETKKCVNTLVCHTSQVNCLELVGHGMFASGSSDNKIKIWDATENICLKTLTGHHNAVVCIKSLDANTIASGSLNEIKIWKIDTEKCTHTLTGHTSWIRCVMRLSNGSLVSCSDDKTIKMWNLDESSCINTLIGHTSAIYCLILLESGRLASGSDDKSIKIWDLNAGECVKTLTGHSSYVWRLCSATNGELIVSCSLDKTIKIWNVASGECVRTLVDHTTPVRAIKTMQDNTLISCSDDGAIKTWDLKTGTCTNTSQGHEGKAIYDLLLI